MNHALLSYIHQHLSTQGIEGALVGGAVRDHLLGLPVKDHDILLRTGGVTTPELLRDLRAAFPGVPMTEVGEDFGVVKAVIGGEEIDFAVIRSEESTGPRQGEFRVTGHPGGRFEDDLARRDLTFNAMALRLESGQLLDPFGGQRDLAAGVIRCVGNPDERFREDSIRILRVGTFMARLNLLPTPETVAGAVRNAGLLRHTHPARIWKELYKEGSGGSLLAGPHVGGALQFLAATGTLNVIIPEWEETLDFEQHNPHHDQSVEGHLLRVAGLARDLGAGPETVFAAALHDLGKPRTFSHDGSCAHFYGHEDVGAQMARAICARLGTPLAVQEKVVTLVALHMQPGQVFTPQARRRLANRAGAHYGDLVTLHHADRLAHVGESPEACAARAAWLRDVPAEVARFDERCLALSGRVLLGLGLSGKQVGDIKKALTALVIDDDLPNEEEPLLAYARAHLL